MAKKRHKKHMRILVTIPDEIGEKFIHSVPNGKRSGLVSNLIREYIIKTFPKKSSEAKTFWDEVDDYIKGDYSNEDPVKTAKDAWKYID